MLGKKKAMGRERAEEVAVLALGYLAEEPDRLVRFMMASGVDPATIARQAGETSFQAAIIDYLLSDESLLLVFCAGQGLDPAQIAQVASLLAAPSRD